MTAKSFLSVACVLLVITFNFSCSSSDNYSSLLGDKEELTVAISMDMPGYFAMDGEVFGYQYDLLRAYADDSGMELKVLDGKTPDDMERLLRSGKVDIAAMLSPQIDGESASVSVYNTSFVVLAGKKEARAFNKLNPPSLGKALDGKKLLVSSSFKSTRTYGTMLDSLKNTVTFVSSRSCIELIEALRSGEYDYLICEKSEAGIGCALVLGITQIYDFKEQAEVCFVLNSGVEGLREDFSQWLFHYRNSNEYAMLNDLYFEKGIVGQFVMKGSERRIRRGISDFDNVMREVCGREGVDWRFMSAIAYHESRFSANVVSNRGARGLMQVMPSVARQFNVSHEEMMKPEVNILLAVRLLDKIESSLKLPRDISYEDRMSIILACYNCGIGHVLDARRLAVKYGGDPNLWDDVSLFLQRKADPEYNNDAVVKCGRLSAGGSRQTLAFVNNVMGRYSSYCAVVKK